MVAQFAHWILEEVSQLFLVLIARHYSAALFNWPKPYPTKRHLIGFLPTGPWTFLIVWLGPEAVHAHAMAPQVFQV